MGSHEAGSMVLPRLSMNDLSGPLLTNLHRHRRPEWFWVDVDGYKIVNVYKPHQFVCKYLISQYSHIPVFMLATLIASMLIGVMMPTVQTENVWLAGQIPRIFPYSITLMMLPASTLAAGIQVPTRILHSSVLIWTVVYLTDMSQKSFQGLNIDPRILLHRGLLVLYHASL